MPQQQEPNNSSMLIGWKPGFNLATLLADAFGASFWPFTRSHMGTRGMGMAGFWAMLGIPIYAGLTRAPALLSYWHFWFAMAICQRILADPTQHSQYRGRPWMFSWCTNSEMTARLLEAATMPLLGAIVSAFSLDVGHFITVAGTWSYVYRYVLDAMTVARRKEASADAIHEMRATQIHFQREGRDR